MNTVSILNIEQVHKGKILRHVKDNQSFVVIYSGALSIKLAAVEGCKVRLFPVSNFKLEEWRLVEE